MKRSYTKTTTPPKRVKTVARKKTSFGAVAIPRGLAFKTGFPKQMKITHKYCEGFMLAWNGPTANVAYQSWSVNGLFDPNLAVGGHQPLYFDQMAALYNHYTVMASRCVVQMLTNNTTTYAAGIYIDDDSTPTTQNLETVMEQNSAITKIGQYQFGAEVYTRKWDAKAAFGGNVMDNDNLQGTSVANPTEQQAFIVYQRPLDGITTSTVTGFITIYYDTVWDELKQVGGS